MPRNKQYVCGFMFNRAETRVLLLLKDRPTWQAGKFNGVGGSIEPGETYYEAMKRETMEEVGLEIGDWHYFVSLYDLRGWAVHFFFGHFGSGQRPQQKTSEAPRICSVKELPSNVIPNLRWLIPMALTISSRGELAHRFDIEEKGEGT